MKKIKIILFFLFFYLVFNIEGKSSHKLDILEPFVVKKIDES